MSRSDSMRPLAMIAAPPSRILRTQEASSALCAAHVHNYERFERDNILFLVSGGGRGKPEAVRRSAADMYKNDEFPNVHYLRFQLVAGQLRVEMVHLNAYAAAEASWSVRDRFALDAKTP